jgi:hypothetical protein
MRLIINGSGFPTDTSLLRVYIDDYLQNIVIADSTADIIKADITGLKNLFNKDIYLFVDNVGSHLALPSNR